MINATVAKITRLPLLLAMLAAMTGPSRADTWTFDKQHTEIRFSWDHLGISRKSARFLDFDGTLEFTPTDPVGGNVEVRIRAASIATGVKALDDSLRSVDFFNVAQFPQIEFKSTGVRKTGEKTGELAGDLTIMGVTRPIVLQATWNFTGEHPMASFNPVYIGKWVSGFSARAEVLRSEFGLKRAIPFASDEIEIVIEAEFLRQD